MRANNRHRLATRWRLAAPVAAILALAVAGCGQSQLGAAALYGSQRVSSTGLADEVANLNAGYQQYKGKVQISYKPAQMPRMVLSWMLRFATVERMAKRNRIYVSPAGAQAQLALEAARAKQSGDTLHEVAVLNGLPPDMLPELGRWFAIQNKLAAQLDNHVTPKTATQQAALSAKLNHQQCLAARSLNITVNPQYGNYNLSSLSVVPSVSALSALPVVAKSPAPSPSPAASC